MPSFVFYVTTPPTPDEEKRGPEGTQIQEVVAYIRTLASPLKDTAQGQARAK